MVEKEDLVKYLVIGLICVGLAGLLLVLRGVMTGYAVFEDSGSNFSLGTYVNTTYNGSAVVLVGSNLSGSYTSQIFDAGNDAVWNNISYTSNSPDIELLFCIDGGGDIYKSVNSGVTWTMSQENYGRTTATTNMLSNPDYLYILSSAGNEVWRSADGTGFAVVYNDFEGKSPYEGESDSSGNLYVVTGVGEVWRSSDNGTTWTKQGDFNGASINDPKGIAIDSNDYIYIVGGAGNVFKSTDLAVTWVKMVDGYGGGTETDDLSVDSNNYLYILLNKKIYKSIDLGATWGIINDSISSYSNNGMRMLIDSNGNFYIADGVGRVFKSTNSGVSWNEIGDCNNDASNDPKGLTNFIKNSNLTFYARSCDDDACSGESWVEVSNPLSLGLSNNRYFQYNVDFTSPDSSITSTLSNVSIDYFLVNSAPTISLVSPQNGATYGYNESLDLNFSVSDSDDNIDSCWYNINDGNNIAITSCANTTFGVAGNGDYVFNIYGNDTGGEEVSDSSIFSVQVGAPTVVLNFPIDEYLNYQENIRFNYTPTDVDLDSCELWGDFDEDFKLNQTDRNVVSGQINNFNLNLSDGTYLWNIKCNDSVGNSAVNGNKTFYVDTLNPNVSLTEPSGAKTSRTVSAFWSVSDENLESCLYNVYRGVNVEIGNTPVNCSASSASFEVTVDADFVFNFYVNDSAGNSNLTNSSFYVDTSLSPPSNGGGDGGGSSGGGTVPETQTAKLLVSGVRDIIAREGDKKTLSLNVKNTGDIFLNNCRLVAKGDISSWIYSTKVSGIAPGESVDFAFDLNVPEEIESGDYSGELEAKCDEKKDVQEIIISIPKGLGLIEIKDIKQEKNVLTIIYNFDNSNVIGEEASVDIWLEDSDGYEITRFNDIFNIKKEGPIERNIKIELENVAGIYYVYLALSDDLGNFVKKSIVLGEAESTGFVVFDTTKGKIGVYIVFLLVIGAGVFFIWRKHGKVKHSENKWFFGKKKK